VGKKIEPLRSASGSTKKRGRHADERETDGTEERLIGRAAG
jgi:hypothetical protein